MTSRARLVTALVIVVFIAFLVYSTLEVQRVECTVTVDFQGERRTRDRVRCHRGVGHRAGADRGLRPPGPGHGREHRLRPPAADRGEVPDALTGR